MDGFAPALASALLHSLWQDALLGVAAALALRAMAGASAAARHNVAMVFLIAMVAVPALHFVRVWQADAPVDAVMSIAGLEQTRTWLSAVMVAAWFAGAASMLVRYAGGLRAIAAMERGAYVHLPPVWRRRADELSAAMGVARAVAIRLSGDVLTPCATGLLRPIVWLPASMLTRTPADQLEALIAHELAHIARMDWLWNAVQCVIESVLFFNPAVWWLSRRIRQEREHACDDLSVAAGGDAIALAEALAALGRAQREALRLSLAAQGGALLQRVRRLLSSAPDGPRANTMPMLGALVIAMALVVSQLGGSGARLPDLQVSASTAGVLGPGDYRQIAANDNGVQRLYRAQVDARGRLIEKYSEDGRVLPIDARVRAWIADVMNQSLPPGADQT